MVNITHATSETSETKSKNRTFRRFVATIFGKDGAIPVPPEWDQLSQKLEFFAYGHETCPSNGRPHLQCYGYTKTPMRLPGIIKALAMPQNSHPCVAEMKGDFKSNEAYCSKQGELVKMGREPAQGQRNDIIAVKRLIDSGKRPMEIADEYEEHFGTVAKFDGFLNRYHSYKRRKLLQDDRSMPDVIIKWGPPRTGKTAWCDDEFGTSGWQRVPGKGVKWFNNCDCDVVLFDDVKINEIPPIGAILELTDRYLVDVDSKYGGLIPWKPKTVVFTSNYPPGS